MENPTYRKKKRRRSRAIPSELDSLKNALSLIMIDSLRLRGLSSLRSTLLSNRLTNYHELIFEELLKVANQFDEHLLETLNLLDDYYFKNAASHDKLAEMIIYRIARSTNYEICKICLEKLLSLVKQFDESIAKHSKQILKLADLNTMTSLNPMLIDILVTMGEKLPQRRS